MREAHPQPLAFPSAPVTAGHVGSGPGLIDEGKALGFEVDLTVEPVLALPQDVGTVLLDRVPGLFLRVIP
jgi:transposase